MNWLKSHWRWGMFNTSAVCVMLYVLTQGTTDWTRTDTFDSGLESGTWAIRFLLVSLSMTPLNTYFGWSSAITLRKSAGLWSFGFACVHVLLYIRESSLDWLTWPLPDFLVLGFAGMCILAALAVTSNKRSMKQLGKGWKQLHRRVYLAGVAVTAHSLLATQMSKKLMFRDPEALSELKVYAAVLCLVLVVRVPVVRQLLLQIPHFIKQCRKRIKYRSAELLPQIHGRESSVSAEPTFMIVPLKIIEQLDANRILENEIDRSPSTEFPVEEEKQFL